MRKLVYKMDIEEDIFCVLKIKFDDEEDIDEFVSLSDVKVNYDIDINEFIEEVEKQEEVVKNYLRNKKEFIESHKGKFLKEISQRDSYYLDFKTEDILVLDKEIDIENLSNADCFKNIKLNPNKIYKNKASLNVNCKDLDSLYLTVNKVSYRTITIMWKQPKENWIESYAVRLAIYNKISKIFDNDFAYSAYTEYFHMLKDNQLTMKEFIKKFDVSKNK